MGRPLASARASRYASSMSFPSYRRDSVEELLASCTPPVRRLVQAARKRLLELVPGATERLRVGWGILGYDAPGYFAFVAPQADHVRIGFERGVLLDDPGGILEGRGSQVRHVCIRSEQDLAGDALARLVRQAAEMVARRAPPRRGSKRGPGRPRRTGRAGQG